MAATTFLDGRVILHPGDCLEVLDTLPEASVDAVVTDPPYHFDTIVQRFGKEGSAEAGFGTDGVFRRASAGFMGKQWDGGDIAFDPATWAKVLRVLKPGGMLAAFSAPKCYHKMAFAIELAGFEMRDRIVHLYDLTERELAFLDSLSAAQADALAEIIAAGDPLGDLLWTFGQGFPKGLDLAKAIDKHLGTPGEVVAQGAPVKRMIPGADQNGTGRWIKDNGRSYQPGAYVPGSEEAARWDGWNIALKPAYEPIALARKPIAEKSVAAQVLATGTGAINIDACRIEASGRPAREVAAMRDDVGYGGNALEGRVDGSLQSSKAVGTTDVGRWPANVIHDGSDQVVAAFPDAPGQQREVNDSFAPKTGTAVYGDYGPRPAAAPREDSGSAARFFYTAKASAEDRLGSGHPTVKPVNLKRHLCRLLCPPGGTILDPFAGTGTTGEAAVKEGFRAVLIEREAEYQADIARRMELAFESVARRRAHAAKVRAERAGAAPDPGPLFGTPGVAGGGGQAGASTATSGIRTDDRSDRPQAMNEVAG